MSEKTEEPTDKKIRDARKKGQVAHSKDLTQAILTLSLLGYLIVRAQSLVAEMARMIALPATLYDMPFEAAAATLIDALLRDAALLLLPVIGIIVVLGIFAETVQVGVLFAFEALKPSGKKLDVGANFKNMFGAKAWIEFGKSVLKVSLLCVVVVMVLRRHMGTLLLIERAGLDGVGAALGAMLEDLFLNVSVVFGVIAVFDFVWQKRRYRKDLMMSKDEVKREHKESEGDPHIKQKRKQLHMQLLSSNATAAARQASVVVTNPTHIAVAIRYEDEIRTPLPIVLAKASGEIAFAMIAAAREAGVPVMQNIPLARGLLAKADVERHIPVEFIEPVAQLLRAVAELSQEAP